MSVKTTRAITLNLTIECGERFTDDEVRWELLRQHGSLRYVWNNCRTLYGPSGVEILTVTEG